MFAALPLLALAATAFAVVRPMQDASPPSSATGAERPEDERPLEDLSRLGEDAPPADPPASTVPAFGIQDWRGNQLGPADFALIRRSGTGFFRFNLVTSSSDDRERGLPIAKYDRLLRAGVSQGIEFLPVLLRSRTDLSDGEPRQVAEPPETERERATWRNRVRLYAERYGVDGRFWRENPDLPYRPIRAWEVWNEPNLRQFWDRREVDPDEYARLLRETRAVLRSVDPDARIVSAGLASRYDPVEYLSALLDEVGACRVDAIGIHPYGGSAAVALGHLENTRAAANAGGADDVPLWSTEVGWRVGATTYSGVPDARSQALQYRRFLAAVDRRRDELGLGPTFAFALRDRVDPQTGEVLETTGLRLPSDQPRPAWEVWTRAASSTPPLELPEARRCGR